MSRRLVSVMLAGMVMAASCGDQTDAAVDEVLEPALAGTAIGARAPGADGPGHDGTTTETTVTPADGPGTPGVLDPTERQTLAARTAAVDLVDAFVTHLDAGRLEQAATLTTGDATALLRELASRADCGVAMGGATWSGEIGEVELVVADTYRVDLAAVLQVDGAPPRTMTSLAMVQNNASAWLIADLVVDGRPAGELIETDLSPDRQRDIRLTPVAQCLGPDRIVASYLVENVADEPLRPTDIYFLAPDGRRYDLDEGYDVVVDNPIAGETSGVPWDLSVTVPNGFDGGAFVLVDVDEDRSTDQGATVSRERVYEVVPSSLFSDRDPAAVVAAPTEEPTP